MEHELSFGYWITNRGEINTNANPDGYCKTISDS